MRFRIPAWYDKGMDWLANHLLPPPTPTGFKIFGYSILWLDVGVAVILCIIAAIAGYWYGTIMGAVLTFAAFALVWMLFEWFF